MKIPKTIDILGYKYTVIFAQEIKDDQGRFLDGQCNYTKRQIYISKELNKDDTILTFLHECGHALEFELGLHLTQYGLLPDVREIIVEGFAKWIHKTFILRFR